MRRALLLLFLAATACSDDCEWWDESCRAAQEREPPGPPSVQGRNRSEECLRRHLTGLPLLWDALSASGRTALPWPGGESIEIEIDAHRAFANDAERDGFLFRGFGAIEPDGNFRDGRLEIAGLDCDLVLDAWELSATWSGRLAVRGAGVVGVVQLPGDRTAHFTGSYREPDTTSVPLQFVIPLE